MTLDSTGRTTPYRDPKLGVRVAGLIKRRPVNAKVVPDDFQIAVMDLDGNEGSGALQQIPLF